MAKYDFLNDIDESLFFTVLSEKGEGRFLQAAVAYQLMKSGQASRMALKVADQTSRRMKALPKAEQIRRATIGGTRMQHMLRSNPELKQNHYAKTGKLIREWNQNNPELSKQRKDACADGLAKWRKDNPELAKAQWAKASAAAVEHLKKHETWRKANGISNELALWKKGIDIAHQRFANWKNTDAGLKWRDSNSKKMSELRKDPNSEWNKKMKQSHFNSKAKRESELKNIKIAQQRSHYQVICPKCKASGDNVVMHVHHFNKCTFDEKKERVALESMNSLCIYKSKKDINRVFTSFGFDLKYFEKYKIFERFFKKLYPDKKTNGLCVVKEFDIESYFKELQLNEINRKIDIKHRQIERAKIMRQKKARLT